MRLGKRSLTLCLGFRSYLSINPLLSTTLGPMGGGEKYVCLHPSDRCTLGKERRLTVAEVGRSPGLDVECAQQEIVGEKAPGELGVNLSTHSLHFCSHLQNALVENLTLFWYSDAYVLPTFLLWDIIITILKVGQLRLGK